MLLFCTTSTEGVLSNQKHRTEASESLGNHRKSAQNLKHRTCLTLLHRRTASAESQKESRSTERQLQKLCCTERQLRQKTQLQKLSFCAPVRSCAAQKSFFAPLRSCAAQKHSLGRQVHKTTASEAVVLCSSLTASDAVVVCSRVRHRFCASASLLQCNRICMAYIHSIAR